MNKKFLLTSLFALGFAGPAMAATTVNSFPDPQAESPAEVLPDRIYTGAATYGNIHVYSGDVWAVAQYIRTSCDVTPGNYLETCSADSGATNSAVSCLNGYYCPGGLYEYQEGSVGLEQCPNGYNSSDSNAVADVQCYKACVKPAGATTMKGHAYYGYGMSTCEPVGCVQGWTMNSGSSVSMNSATIGNGFACFYVQTLDNGNYSRNYDSSSCPEDSGAVGIVMGEASFYDMSSSNNLPGEWAVNYGYQHGSVRGIARLSEVSGTPASAGVNSASNVNPTIKTMAELGAEGGNNCYCTITGYRPYTDQGNPQKDKWHIVNSSWAYAGTSNSLGACAGSCASVMRTVGANDLVYRSALLGSITSVQVPATCAANNITIVWNAIIEDKLGLAGGGSMTWIGNNTASSNVSYDGDIATPTNALQKPGKTFSGWRFSTTAAPAEQ